MYTYIPSPSVKAINKNIKSRYIFKSDLLVDLRNIACGTPHCVC